MNVGFVGLGKLGLPVAMAMAAKGMHVYGWDVVETDVRTPLRNEEGYLAARLEAKDRFHPVDLRFVVKKCDVIFVAVQTPHESRFEGVTRLPEDRADFDYSHLVEAVAQIASEAFDQDRSPTIAVISTVLPGTLEREIEPLLMETGCELVYNPSFIAMGTVIPDFLDPEFVLLGGDPEVTAPIWSIYSYVFAGQRLPSIVRTTIANAELIKVAYNTFIGLKLAFANTLMEVCHKLPGTDVDKVTDALKLADRRLISGAYLDAGMGDGGGCHPRDNIALSWLARELDLSHDLFEDAMKAREHQAQWLVDLMCQYSLPKGILGIAYKPGSHITTGSPAVLVENMLREQGEDVLVFDTRVHLHTAGTNGLPPTDGGQARVWLVGCKHPEFPMPLPAGSIVIDPWRFWPSQDGIEVIHVGAGVPAYDRA